MSALEFRLLLQESECRSFANGIWGDRGFGKWGWRDKCVQGGEMGCFGWFGNFGRFWGFCDRRFGNNDKRFGKEKGLFIGGMTSGLEKICRFAQCLFLSF